MKRLLAAALGMASMALHAADFKVTELAERQIDGRNQLCLSFSQPVDQSKDLSGYIDAHSKRRNESGDPVFQQSSWKLEDEGRLLCLAETESYTKYKIKVGRGLPAADGQTLSDSISKYASTRKIKPAISFIDAGMILTPGNQGRLPVATLDVSQVDINFHRVHEEHLTILMTNYNSSWKWRLLKNLPEMSDLVYGARFDLDAPLHQRVERSIPLSDIQPLKKPGVYVAVMNSAEDYTSQENTKLFMVSDIGLHARSYASKLVVTALSLETGKPMAGVTVRLLNQHGEFLRQQTTNIQGQISITDYSMSDSKKRPKIALAMQGESMSMLDLSATALDLSDFSPVQRAQYLQELMIYAPRDLYRPGETAQFNMLLRDQDGRLAAEPVLSGEIIKPDNRSLKSFTLTSEGSGFYQYQLDIPANAATGLWSVAIKRPGTNDKVVYPFKVEEFLPERMKLAYSISEDFKQFAPEVLPETASIDLQVQGDYLYGAPAAGNKFEQKVIQSPVQTGLKDFETFYFGDASSITSRTTQLGEVILDDNGRYVAKLPIQKRPLKAPARLTYQGSLYESNGRAVNRRWSRLIWPDANMIGIRGDFDFKTEYAQGNSQTEIQLVRLNHLREMIAGDVELTLVRRLREGYWEYSESRGWDYIAQYREYDVQREKITLDKGKPVTVSLPLKWGDYRLEVRDPDSKLLTRVELRAGRDWYWRWQQHNQGNQASRPDKISMALDKASYRAGDIAKVSIKPPYLPSRTDGKSLKFQALVQVEADEPLWQQWVEMDQDGMLLEIPVDYAWDRHDLYISVLLTRPVGDEFEQKMTRRAMGIIHLPLDRQDRKLDIQLDLPEKTLPNQMLEVPISVSSEQDLPDNLQITIAAVDQGVLALTDFKTPDPLDFFFSRRAYQVQARDIFHRLIKPTEAQMARLRFGGDAPARGGKRNVSDVQIVSLFTGPIKLDAQGRGIAQFKLPDFSGQLRFMALAFSDQMSGSTQQNLTVATPVVAQLAMPRFISKGDRSMIALDLNNISGEQQTVTANFATADGLQLLGKTAFTVTLNDRQKQTLTLPLEASLWNGLGELSLQVSGVRYQGEVMDLPEKSWRVAMRPAWPESLQYVQKKLDKGQQDTLSFIDAREYDPASVQASLLVSDTAPLDVASYLRSLLHYPYGCLEQTLSSAQPWLIADQPELKAFNVSPKSQQDRSKAMDIAFKRLQQKQKSSGGFGLWSDRSPEEYWLTVFAVDFFQQAQQQGFPVDQYMLEKATTRLKEYLKQGPIRNRYGSDNKHYRLATRAYAGYVLSATSQASLGDLRRLFDDYRNDAKSPLPLVHLAIALDKMGDQKRANQAVEQAFSMQPRQRFWSLDYGTPVRDRALMISLLIENELAVDKARLQSFNLAKDLQGDYWLSTQEQHALVKAALAMQQSADTPWQLQTQDAQLQTLSGRGSQRFDLQYSQLLEPLSVKADRAMFARLEMTGYRVQPPQAYQNKMTIERNYYNAQGDKIKPDYLSSGDLVLVELIVRADQRVPDALLVELLPAGLELENQNLGHSMQIDQLKIGDKTVAQLTGYTDIEHQEFRDDRFVAAINVSGYRPSKVYYLARAVTPGRYQLPATSVESMYHPEVRANTSSDGVMEILAR